MQTTMSDHQFDTTHSPVCWSWGTKHYECAVRQVKELQEALTALKAENEALRAEMDYVRAVLREQRQRDEVLLQQALDVMDRGMLNHMRCIGVAAAIAKVELEGDVDQLMRRAAMTDLTLERFAERPAT